MKETLIIFILLRLIFPKHKILKNYHKKVSVLYMNISMVNILLNLDLNYNTQKNYQKFYYSTTPMKSTFKMSLQNNKKGRNFY